MISQASVRTLITSSGIGQVFIAPRKPGCWPQMKPGGSPHRSLCFQVCKQIHKPSGQTDPVHQEAFLRHLATHLSAVCPVTKAVEPQANKTSKGGAMSIKQTFLRIRVKKRTTSKQNRWTCFLLLVHYIQEPDTSPFRPFPRPRTGLEARRRLRYHYMKKNHWIRS